MNRDTDDHYDSLAEATYQDMYQEQVTGAKFAERLQEAGRSNDEPKSYDIQLTEDATRAWDEHETRIAARETTDKRYGSWLKLAKENNTTIPDYLDRVYAIEQTLKRNPAEGMATIAHNMGFTPLQVISGMGAHGPIAAQHLRGPRHPRGCPGAEGARG